MSQDVDVRRIMEQRRCAMDARLLPGGAMKTLLFGWTLLTAMLLSASAAAAMALPKFQHIDNLSAPECQAQVQQGIASLLAGNDEAPDVARSLAASAVQAMAQIVNGVPRLGSRLSADLRIHTTDARFASSSGKEYRVYTEKGPQGCRLHLENSRLFHEPTQNVPACTCEPSQDD
jgi:hypothetical protein